MWSKHSKFIVFVRELSGGYEAIFVLIFFGEDVLHHVLVQRVVGRVAMTLKLFPQVLLHLAVRTEMDDNIRNVRLEKLEKFLFYFASDVVVDEAEAACAQTLYLIHQYLL